jgi:hypothetical protein
MSLAYFFVDMLGAILAVLVVVYWAFAGRIVLQIEQHWIIKIVLIAGLLVYPVYTPLVIYLLYYKHILPHLKALFARKQKAV